jgi:hypothetical protein
LLEKSLEWAAVAVAGGDENRPEKCRNELQQRIMDKPELTHSLSEEKKISPEDSGFTG